jgi:hypothetical protein
MPALFAALSDGQQSVRLASANSLKQIGPGAATPKAGVK